MNNIPKLKFKYLTLEETIIKEINDYYIEMAEGMPRPLAEYYEVTPNISFKEFNNYINSLDEKIISSRSK